MDQWPFEEDDWREVEAMSRRYIEAVFADDFIVADSVSREMYEKTTELERKYGEHPWIVETRADFADDSNEKLRLYERALELAEKYRHDTLTVRIWLADLLLDEFDDPLEARRVLTDGQHEVLEADQDEDWIRMYEELLKRIQERLEQ